jgi:hypothetical protein
MQVRPQKWRIISSKKKERLKEAWIEMQAHEAAARSLVSANRRSLRQRLPSGLERPSNARVRDQFVLNQRQGTRCGVTSTHCDAQQGRHLLAPTPNRAHCAREPSQGSAAGGPLAGSRNPVQPLDPRPKIQGRSQLNPASVDSVRMYVCTDQIHGFQRVSFVNPMR